MDKSKGREDRELAEQRWRELPAEERELLREVVRHTIAENPELCRAPYEEVALPEVVDELAISMLTQAQAQASARVEEYTTHEGVTRWMIEARNLLPDDAPEDMVMGQVHGPGAPRAPRSDEISLGAGVESLLPVRYYLLRPPLFSPSSPAGLYGVTLFMPANTYPAPQHVEPGHGRRGPQR